MQIDSGKLQERRSHFRNALNRAGLKVTHQRIEIFNEVAKSLEHPDAETIFQGVRERVSSISLDTVYRTLWLFLDLGIITTLGPPHTKTRFDADTNLHHHFVCLKCGMTRDFYSEEFDRLEIPQVVRDFGKGDVAQVEIKGTCLKCLSEKNKSIAPGAERRCEK
ncbi:MAG TPA: transcriptional repressor [Anaerolineae bacterium]|nr:transcriptional repressor [Anaerolineae bacterium]